MGSGTTGVVAGKAGRHFIGIELDQGHFETASHRLGLLAPEHREAA
jgi:DNA modification methylase